MTIMMYIFRSRIRWNITSVFIVAGIAGWAFGGFTGVETGWWGTNAYLHNTLNVVGHIHLVLLMGSVLLGLGIIYSVVPALTKRRLSPGLGYIHLGLTVFGGFGLALMFTYLGFAGFIRREAVVPDEFSWALPWLLFFALTVGFAQLVFVYNFFGTLARSRKSALGETTIGEPSSPLDARQQNSYPSGTAGSAAQNWIGQAESSEVSTRQKTNSEAA
jgi:heme/copper-type cytochrome/quinol oxidase subunit 1